MPTSRHILGQDLGIRDARQLVVDLLSLQDDQMSTRTEHAEATHKCAWCQLLAEVSTEEQP